MSILTIIIITLIVMASSHLHPVRCYDNDNDEDNNSNDNDRDNFHDNKKPAQSSGNCEADISP